MKKCLKYTKCQILWLSSINTKKYSPKKLDKNVYALAGPQERINQLLRTDTRARIKVRALNYWASSVKGLSVMLFCQHSVRISGYARNFVVVIVRGMFQRIWNKTFTSIKRSCHKLLWIFERRHNFRGFYLNSDV